jgi:DNA mismatch repair protein MutS
MALTPMMQQYHDAKAKHPGMLLLFRMGDFYELFDDDAVLVSQLLQITLTSRDKQVPMAGFPHHALDTHLRKLLSAGYRVAICDQVEDPATAKGLVKREVTRVVTPGTLMEDGLLDPLRANHLAAVFPDGDTAALAWVELASDRCQACSLPLAKLADELGRLEIRECLWPENKEALLPEVGLHRVPGLSLTLRAAWHFEARTARETVFKHFGVGSVQGFGFADDAVELRPTGALLTYLQETIKTNLDHLRRLVPFRPDGVMILDAVTRQGLELVRALSDGRKDTSLLAAINRTVTAMGSRLLQEWLLAPLTDAQAIAARHQAVAELKGQPGLRRDVQDTLRAIPDVPRLTARACAQRATPRDLAAVGLALRALPGLKTRLANVQAPRLRELVAELHDLPDLQTKLAAALVDQPPLNPRDGGLIRPGFSADLDHFNSLSHGGKEWMAQYQATEIARTGINSLKVGYNQVFGYYIEITHAHAAKVPAEYQRKQTLKNAERYITAELKTYEEQVLRAEEKAKALEYELFLELRAAVAADHAALLATAAALAQLDVLVGLAELADAQHYVQPTLVTEPTCQIQAGRHPVLEQTLPPGTFVPNETDLRPEAGMLWLITGPNMAGKSTYIRQVALTAILAQMGSFVPAQSATLGIVDRIFTRIGAGDDLARGHSTFMVEMAETANILNNATGRSLVILDEIGRGTSTYDGLALAWAIVEHLHDQVGCRTLFATHYHELTDLATTLPRLRNYNVMVEESGGEVVFLHRIAAGPASQSYGIHVAQLAGVPKPVLSRARQVLKSLENQFGAFHTDVGRKKRKVVLDQPSLFGDDEPTPFS